MGADFLLEFVVPGTADDVRGRKKVKTAAKSVGRQTRETSWVVVAGKGRHP